MRFLSVLTTLVVAATATPINLAERGSCSIGSSSVTVGSTTQTMTGPFFLTVSQASEDNGNYAASGVGGNIVFGRKYSTNAIQFYLTSSGGLVSVTNGVESSAYRTLYNNHPHITLGTKAGSNPLVTCTMSSSCALTCSVDGGSDQCLSSPKYQPDWRISSHKSPAGCIDFVPLAVAVN